MAGKTLQIVAITAAVAVAGTVTVAVMASGNFGGQDGSFIGHLHLLVEQQRHGRGGHDDTMAQIIEHLNLTPDQLQRVEKVQELVGSYSNGGHAAMLELHEELVTQFERGEVSTTEIRRVIDEHIKEPAVASALTDELVGLVKSLDDTQRGILLEHLPETGPGGGHGH